MTEKTDQFEIWSWKENYPGTDISDYIGQSAADELGDIQLKVPNAKDFLNTQTTDIDTYNAQKKALSNYINMIRKKYGEKDIPQAAMTQADYDRINALKAEQDKIDAYKRLSEDPLKEYDQRFQQYLSEDDRNAFTFISQSPDLLNALLSGDMDKFADGVFNYGKDSIMGTTNTALRLLPDNNKLTWALTGEVLSNLPLYAADKKRFMKQFTQSPGKDPVLSGATAASAGFGAYAGANLYDMANQITRYLQDIPEPALRNDPQLENLLLARNALLFTGGAASLGPMFKGLSKGTALTLGVSSKAAKDIAQVAMRQDIPFGIAQASQSAAVKAYAKVVGVFPFVGTPFRQAKANINWLLDQKVVSTLNELAPVQHMMDLGKLITADARKKYNAFARLNARLYDNFYSNASKLDDLLGAGRTTRYGESAFEGGAGYIPTGNIKAIANLWKEKTERGMVRLQGYAQGQPDTMGGLANLENFDAFLLNLSRLPDHVNANQFRALQKDFNKQWREYSKLVGEGDEIVGDAAAFKRALEEGLNDTKNWKLPANFANSEEAKKLMATTVESLDSANYWFGKHADTFKTPVSKHVSLVDENVFGAGVNKPGWMYEDQLANDIFNSFLKPGNQSAMAVKDLAKIVKPETFKKAARQYIQQAYDAAGETYQHTFNNKTKLTTLPSKTVSKEKAFLEANPGGVIKDQNGMYTRDYLNFQMPKERVKVTTGDSGTKIVDVQIFNGDKFASNLGLGTDQGDAMLKQFYLSMGHDDKAAVKAIDNLKDLVQLSKIESSVRVAETAQFVARRAVLAGASGITGAFIATNFGNPLIGVGMAMVARYGSNILTDPKRLQMLTNITNEGLTEKARRANYVRLARLVFADENIKNEIPEGLDVTDVDDTMNFLMGSTFTFNDADREALIREAEEKARPFIMSPDAIEQPPAKTFTPSERFPTNIIPKPPTTNVSDEIKTSSITSNYMRRKGGNLNPGQRASLAEGNLYGAIAQAKGGGFVNRQGIMHLAGRRKP
jgi:hypothetical protein